MSNIKAVATVVEQREDNQAVVAWRFNPVPEGAELLWDHGGEPCSPDPDRSFSAREYAEVLGWVGRGLRIQIRGAMGWQDANAFDVLGAVVEDRGCDCLRLDPIDTAKNVGEAERAFCERAVIRAAAIHYQRCISAGFTGRAATEESWLHVARGVEEGQ